MTDSSFDRYATEYDEALQAGLSVSGEASDFFALSRVRWLRDILARQEKNVSAILDFGCGVGATTKHFLDEFAPRVFKGVDTSAASIDVARQGYHSTEKTSDCEVRFACLSDADLLPQYDLVYCNGVFHHIDIEKRLEAMRFIAGSLRPGGVFAFWENNPYSLPARYVMSRIPFDHDAVMVWPRQARDLIQKVGLEIVRTDYCFIFPAALSWLRWTEQLLCKVPLGAQYLVVSVKGS